MAHRKLGKYEVIERLGRGGMAEVYRAYHANLDRYVAIKVLHTFLADDPEFKSRFEKEAQNVAKLRHPNIVQVYDFDYDDESGSYYMVMELISGVTLKDRIVALEKNGELVPANEALRITREAASALAYAHSRSMIHRDVKPANLMLDQDNRIVLTDFGIAKIVTGAQFTVSGGMVGTPAYMAPEQGLGEAGDERSDLYSVGVILYQLATGKLPYEAETPLAVILKHMNEPVTPPQTLNPSVSPAVDQIILKLMSKRPEDRYQTAAEVIADLESAERGDSDVRTKPARDPANIDVLLEEGIETTLVLPQSPVPSVKRDSSNRWIGGGIFVLLLLLVGGFLYGAANGLVPGVALFASSSTATEEPSSTLAATDTEGASTTIQVIVPTMTPTEVPSETPTETSTPTTTSTNTSTSTPSLSPTTRVSNTPTRTPSPTVSPTITRTPTATITFTPSVTYTPSVTRTPTPNLTQTRSVELRDATNQAATLAACVFDYEIVSQEPADNEFFPIDSEYIREITLRNTGNCAWDPLTRLYFVSGENFRVGPSIPLDAGLEVGEEIVLVFEGMTPEEGGDRSGTWQLRTAEQSPIGDPIIIRIRVYDPGG